MSVTGIITQNLTFTFTSTSSYLVSPGILGRQPQAVAANAPSVTDAAVPPEDRVTLSSRAAALAEPAHETPDDPASPATGTTGALTSAATSDAQDAVPPGDSEPGRGAALFGVLDADGDGAVTAEEFVDGARDLLRQAHGHGRRHHHFRFHRDTHLTHRLERLFDRVDANRDGRVDKSELADALDRSSRGRLARAERAAGTESAETAAVQAPPTQSPASQGQESDATSPGAVSGGQSAPAPGVSVTQVTIVTIAIQQYTTISGVDPAALGRTISTTA